jgi:peptidyl-prolyl cis-trans isomerase B (cyclophilin B)
MPPASSRSFNHRSFIVHRQLIILLLLCLPLTACGRYRARKALQKTRYFAEILKRQDMRDVGADGFFRDNLLSNRNPEVRRWCAIALGRIGDPRALPLLYGALHSEDAGVRAASAFAIGEVEDRDLVDARCSVADPRGVMELFRLLDDSSVSVRTRAIEALGKVGSRADAAYIVHRLERLDYGGSEYDKALLHTAITALARLKDAAAIPFLERLHTTRDPEIQRRALEARTRIQSDDDARRASNAPLDAISGTPCGMRAPAGPEPAIGLVTGPGSMALAAYRRNSTIAQIETSRGTIEIELFREDAPVTAERFVSMVKRGVFDDTELTKPPASDLIEGGNPNEWPGLIRTIPREVNMRPFERGRIGMPVSGQGSDAGKFFITLAPQQYLDGINTCFGHVVSGMQIADRLSSGDRIRRITIKEEIHFHDFQRYSDE